MGCNVHEGCAALFSRTDNRGDAIAIEVHQTADHLKGTAGLKSLLKRRVKVHKILSHQKR
jgi:hypothetical protein